MNIDKSKFCSDPLGKHKHLIYKNLREVSHNLLDKCGRALTRGALLCDNCRKHLMKIFSSTDQVHEVNLVLPSSSSTAHQDEVVSITDSSSTVDDNASIASSVSSCDDESSENVKDVLKILEVTPVKKRKYSVHMYAITLCKLYIYAKSKL